ncbi:MAG: hypothetical protein QXS02_01720, partial [Candidatus Thermoplasmatota archaeon]
RRGWIVKDMMKMIRSQDVGDIGIGALIVFIAMVLIAGIAASVLVQTANRLEIQAMQTGEQTKGEVSTGLSVFDINGEHDNGKITKIGITIRPRAGSGDIDLNNTVVEISNGDKKALLSYNILAVWNFHSEVNQTTASIFGTGPWNMTNEEFGIIVLEDEDSSCTSSTPVINRGDKILLCINVSVLFSGLDPRKDVWGAVIPEEGSMGVYAFRVPPSLTDTVYDLY